MKIMSLNMRGWGDRAKRRRLSSFIKSGAFDMCLIQETKRATFDDVMVSNLWGHIDIEWVAKESSGLSGVLLSIWNTDLFSYRYSFTGDGFLGICVEWKSSLLYIVNIYSSCTLSGKRKLWNDLIEFKMNNEPGEWCLGGDFNSTLQVGERRGIHGVGGQTDRADFASFIDTLEVVDIPVTGKRFTWFSSDGSAMSRLDRFLLSDGFIEKGGFTNQCIGDRDISDHCPIWLECSNLNWGPKPFKFFNCWLQHPDFLSFVKDTWETSYFSGKSAFVLKEKLKCLKEALKTWNKEVFGIEDLNINKIVKDLDEVDERIATDSCDLSLYNAKELNKQFWEQLRNKDSLLHKKSRTKWVQEGDSNSRFFHASIKARRRKNQIVSLLKGDAQIQGVNEIKNEAKDHFCKLLSEELVNRPFLEGLDFNTISAEDNAFLLEPI
ncbi:hypothetical protein QL285_016590 [Trifolium repens]|nr:hypothetical protein QL285_016590 [Trifolium repens]